MQTKLHIAIGDYEFSEVDVDIGQAKDVYDEIKRQFSRKDGLDDKSWRNALDKYITTNKLDSSEYEDMNKDQKMVIQEIKKSIKRLDYKKND